VILVKVGPSLAAGDRLLLSADCTRDSTPNTGIIVWVTSDLRVPEDINQVRLAATDPQGDSVYGHTFDLGEGPNRFQLPFRVGLFPLHDTSTPIHVAAVGQLNDDSQPVVWRSATLSFVHSKKVDLVLPLLAVCRPAQCTVAFQTCKPNGNCESDAVESSTLSNYVPNQPASGADAFTETTDAQTSVVALDALSGTGGVIGTDGGPAADVSTAPGDAPGADVPSDVPLGGSGGTGGRTATGGITASGGTTSTGGVSTAGARTNGGTTTGGGTTASAGTTSAESTSASGGTTESGGTSAGGATPPRCSGLGETCGPSGDESCCTSLPVPGGTFNRSNDASYPATVADFYLDKYEITVGRFRQFVDAGMGTQSSPPGSGAGVHPLIANSGWNSAWNVSLSGDTAALKAVLKCLPAYQTWTDTAGDNESRPQNCLDWYTAFAFCAWDGGRLATEAEWNYAAAGGSEQREYPWGSGLDASKASYYDDSTGPRMGDGVAGCSVADLVVVGSKPAGNGKWGQADLAGNVREWTLDWYASPYQNPCDNCAVLTAASLRVVRGCSFFKDLDLSSANRYSDNPSGHSFQVGARCARSSL
jgi:formylglycine-generating enzyme required for sulfatase activity